jgi:peptide/nickel transport system permease protein
LSATTAEPGPTLPHADQLTGRTGGYGAQAVRRLTRQPLTLAALAVLLALFILGGLAHELAPQGWNAIDLSGRWQNHAPAFSGWHLFGTDNIGRDVLVRTLWGLHDTEQATLLGALLATLLGVAIGGLAGLYGGWLDAALMRFVDLITAFPAIVLMIMAFFFLQPLTVWKATAVFSLYMWTQVARALRTRITSLGGAEFVQAARALGASDARLFFRHLLPNAAGTVIVAATSLVGQIILVEATAEFFGFGVNSLVRPTLGNLIADATTSGIGSYNQLGLGWWVWAGPAALLALTLISINLVGDGLNTALNPTITPKR